MRGVAPSTMTGVLALGVALLVTASVANATSVPGGFASRFTPASTHIDHVVILMMENHAFDNYFGTYCPTTGAYCSSAVTGEPAGLCVPKDPTNASRGCVKPYYLGVSGFYTHDLAHTWNSTHSSINGGAMNGFYAAENSGNLPFGTFGGHALPIDWDIAEEYGLGDYFFSSVASYSLPNHWYLVASKAPANSVNLSTPTNGHQSSAYKHTYLNQANNTRTVEDLLNATPSVSWKYYDWSLPTYHKSIAGGWGEIGAYNYWNPLAASAQSYTSTFDSHFVNRTGFFGDAANGTLPDISWVIPGATFSDHPQLGNMSAGQSFIANVVDAVEESPDWSSTAIFITWDEYGGWYDGVAPPTVSSVGLGLRVPLLVISPYVPLGKVVSSLGDFQSLLHFVEWRFKLGCLGAADCQAPLPFGYFDFNQTARAPIIFPTNYTNASYPMSLQTNYSMPFPCPTVCTITPGAWVNPEDQPLIPGVDYS